MSNGKSSESSIVLVGLNLNVSTTSLMKGEETTEPISREIAVVS